MPIPSTEDMKGAIHILEHLDPKTLIEAKVTNVQLCSTRTIRFDLPEGAATDGINRVKVTNMGDGTFRVQLLKIEEVDLIGGVAPKRLSEVIGNFTGVKV